MTDHAATISSIGQISVRVTDIDRAVAFYRDQLGLTLLFQFPGMAFFKCGEVRLYLTNPESPEFAGTSIIYFRVGSIAAAHADLVAKGVTFVESPRKIHADERHELWLASFKDPDGNTLALMSEVPR
jgi:catechol 2,3-dioxygenase-like lactoylglutathione lyase family enzyme